MSKFEEAQFLTLRPIYLQQNDKYAKVVCGWFAKAVLWIAYNNTKTCSEISPDPFVLDLQKTQSVNALTSFPIFSLFEEI